MLATVLPKLETFPTQSSGDRRPFVLQTVEADDKCAPFQQLTAICTCTLHQRGSGKLLEILV